MCDSPTDVASFLLFELDFFDGCSVEKMAVDVEVTSASLLLFLSFYFWLIEPPVRHTCS